MYCNIILTIIPNDYRQCRITSNKNITKTKDLDLTKSQIVNVESGGFGKAPQGKIDKDITKITKGQPKIKIKQIEKPEQ